MIGCSLVVPRYAFGCRDEAIAIASRGHIRLACARRCAAARFGAQKFLTVAAITVTDVGNHWRAGICVHSRLKDRGHFARLGFVGRTHGSRKRSSRAVPCLREWDDWRHSPLAHAWRPSSISSHGTLGVERDTGGLIQQADANAQHWTGRIVNLKRLPRLKMLARLTHSRSY